jgi:hypothetical protein
MTLGSAAAAQVRLIIRCKECQHQVEPDPAEMAARYGAETPVLDWRARLVCSKCGSREIDMVVTGTRRRDWRGIMLLSQRAHDLRSHWSLPRAPRMVCH